MQADTLAEQEVKVDAEAPAAAPVQEQEVAPVPQEQQPAAERQPAAKAGEQPEAKARETGAQEAKVEETKAEEPEAKPSKRPKSTAKKTRTVELTLTVTGTADGEWQADLVHGTKRVVQGLSISAAAVARAAKELHEDIAGGIEEVIETARAQHRTRMEELEAELAKVKAALAELSED